jgi:hypothetical protein
MFRKGQMHSVLATARSPLWVKNGSRGIAAGCLLCPGERTSSGCLGMSEKCLPEAVIRSPRPYCAAGYSGNPAFRRPSINSFTFLPAPRAINADIVKAGSISSARAAASCASASRPRWAKADARQRQAGI